MFDLILFLWTRPLGWVALAVYAAAVLLSWYIVWRDFFRGVTGAWTAFEWMLVALVLGVFCPYVYNYYRKKGFL